MVKIASDNSLSTLAPQIALATMLWMIVWWVTECVPLGVTGLIAPLVFSLSGILSINEAMHSFAEPIIWIFIAGFILAASFQRWGLDKRIAYSLAALYRGNSPRIATFFVACLPVFILTMTGSITASTTIVFPFLVAFMNILDIPVVRSDDTTVNNNNKHAKKISRSNYAEASFLSLGQAATSGAMLLLISTAPNLIAKATIEKYLPGQSLSFDDWFIVGTPHAIIGLFVSWTIIFLMIKPEMNSLQVTRDKFKSQLQSLGKMQREEKALVAILIAAMFLWIVPSLLRSFGSVTDNGTFISNFIHAFSTNVTEAIPALIIIISIAIVRTGRNRPPLLKWNEMTKAVDWNIVLLFGGGLALGMGMESSGLAQWMGIEISSFIKGTEIITPWIVFAVSAVIGFVISYAASNTASAVITCPIAAALAIGVGVNPIPPVIAAGLACSIPSAIPSTTPPMAIIYSSRVVKISNMIKTGVASDLARLMLLVLLGPPLAHLIFR